MGFDSIRPFISDPTKGIFVLCRTSNPSASDFQNIHTDSNNTLFETVARACHEWNKNENIGMVIGATAAEEILKVRKHAPDLPLLIPGIGKQGGDLEKSMLYGNNNGISIINISRSIIFPSDLSEKSIRNEAKNYLLKMRAILDD